MTIQEQIEWLGKEAQRHSQSASDKAFTSRRRGTFKHRAKQLREAVDTMGKLLAVYEAADKYCDTNQGHELLGLVCALNAVKDHE